MARRNEAVTDSLNAKCGVTHLIKKAGTSPRILDSLLLNLPTRPANTSNSVRLIFPE